MLSSPGQISRASATSRCGVSTRIAAAELARLASLGLAFRLTGRPVRYRAIAPDLALNALIGQREEEFRQARARRTRWSGGASRTACPTGPWHGTPATMKRTDVSITRLLLIRVSQADV
jgi:hypothetical protein